jgi:putative glycosyltransferase (TIGR04372 family)
MLSRVKNLIFRLSVALFAGPASALLRGLARARLSGNPVLRGLAYFPSQWADALLGVSALRLISHVSRREPRRRRGRARIRNRTLRAQLYLALGKADPDVASSLNPDEFRKALSEEKLDADDQYALAHQLFQAGRLNLACEAFEDLVLNSQHKFALERRLQLMRDCGIAFFMLGDIGKANRNWARAGELRRFMLGDDSGPVYRIIGGSWFAAIGHVAMLDFYAKYNQLYRAPGSRFVAPLDISNIPGNHLCERLAKSGIDFIEPGRLHRDHDRWARAHGKRRWSQLTPSERFAMTDDFWEFEFPDGQVLGYTHAADRIQKDWEAQQRPPLLSLDEGERQFLKKALHVLGVPEGAWYVCLHVREPGFHKGWNTLYPSMRDANIDDYIPAINLIVSQGGWVIRMGDASMKPLPALPNVVDYAHSTLKTPMADIILALGCRFFLGTNSGFATIPAIYGVRCVFSNWLPIGLPLWPSQDLVLPKIFWDERLQRHLSLEETFASGLAFIQNWSDLPEGIKLCENSADEICQLTAEALGTGPDVPAGQLLAARNSYRDIARRHGSYVGSTLAASFIERHTALLSESDDSHATGPTTHMKAVIDTAITS